jgi:hypothetical protein
MKLSYKPFHVCTILGCYNITRTHELCKYHQYKLVKYGDPLHVKVKKGKA